MAILYGGSGDTRAVSGNPSEAEVSATMLALARQKATALVNSYLEQQFPDIVPWTASGDVPNLINSITDDIASYYIRRDNHVAVMPMSDEVKAEYWEKPISLLEQIRDRKLQLPELTSQLTDEIRANRSAYPTVFDMDDIKKQGVDSDLIDGIAADRE